MLLVDPLKRITIPEIRQHPWFTIHLPRYIAVLQAGPSSSIGTIVDSDLVREVERLGFEHSFIIESLRTRQQNKATVAYHLLADNRHRMPSSTYLKEEMTEGKEQSQYNSRGAGIGSRSSGGLLTAPRIVVDRKWRLGMRTRCHPGHLVQALCRVMREYGIVYKKGRVRSYNLKCMAEVARAAGENVRVGQEDAGGDDESMMIDDGRFDPATTGGTHAYTEVVKFEFQVYRGREGEYTLDVQRLEGNLLTFLSLTSDLMAALH